MTQVDSLRVVLHREFPLADALRRVVTYACKMHK